MLFQTCMKKVLEKSCSLSCKSVCAAQYDKMQISIMLVFTNTQARSHFDVPHDPLWDDGAKGMAGVDTNSSRLTFFLPLSLSFLLLLYTE